MTFSEWADSRVKKLNWLDVQFVKLSSMGFILMIAKLWEPILSLAWDWYAIIFVLAAIPPLLRVYREDLRK